MSMDKHRFEEEARLQARAEQAERERLPAGDPRVDRHRLVLRALRQPLPLELPADFAARVMAHIGHAEERSGPEDWLVTGLLLVMAIVGLVVVQPFVGAIAANFSFSLPALPWSQLLGAAASIAAAWALERLWSRRTLLAT